MGIMWGTLVHLSTNMWYEEGNFRGGENKIWKSPASNKLRFDKKTWDDYIQKLKSTGTNTIILDVGDALVYESHPEIAVEGAWSKEKMKTELQRLNDMGIQVIPKLNFSTTHDVWMKEYSLAVSTREYYQVCSDLIQEVIELFKPKFMHLGLDEEVYENQQYYDYVVIRQNELWWHDLYYLVDCVERNNVRAMMWSDYARHYPEEFIEKCPKSVVQCVWYYFNEFGENMSPACEMRVRPLLQLSDAGFDIFPTGSIEYYDENLELLVKYCTEKVSKDRILGYMQTTWESVEPEWLDYLAHGAISVKNARDFYEKHHGM